jgi:hypothetical protein
VILVPDDLAELVRLEHDVADHAFVAAPGLHVEHADAHELLPRVRREAMAEELIQPAHHEHRRAVAREVADRRAASREVERDSPLSGILAAAADHDVEVFRQRVPRIHVDHPRREPLGAGPSAQREHVAPIAVDVHVAGIERSDDQFPCGAVCSSGTHQISSTSVSSASSLRSASMAVYVQ